MKFNWFKKKEEFTPEAVQTILDAQNETDLDEYSFGWEGDLPIMVADDDFLEFLQEESMGHAIELVELAELFKIWMAENCE